MQLNKDKHGWVRRELVTVLVLKVAALIAIKLMFFSDAPAMTEQIFAHDIYGVKPSQTLTKETGHDRSR